MPQDTARVSLRSPSPKFAQETHRQITDTVRAALIASSHRSLAGLGCEMAGETIVLSGVVPSYYLKQLAQEAVFQLKLAQPVQNGIQVQEPV